MGVREPKAAFGELWVNKTNPGDIDQLGDLTVHRFDIKCAYYCNILDLNHQEDINHNHQ